MSSSFGVEPAENFCDDDSESDEIDAYNERRNILNQKKLENLKKLCAKMDLESEEKRREFLRQFDKLIGNWNCPILNLREFFFGDKPIENLLMESIKYINRDESYRTTEGFIAFVARTGYKIRPKIGNDGKPVPHRTTLIHLAANYLNVTANTIKDLFKIDNSFDVNYICPSWGGTHFHLACKYGCDMIVQEFFKFNQDPNCLCRKTHDSPLHLALENSHHGDRKTVIELLLKNGANANFVNANGSTPLHVICQYVRDDLESTKMLFELSREKYRPLQLDVRDGSGNAPVHWALRRGNEKVFRLLLEKGADANVTNAEGSTPLHILCNQEPEKFDLANSLFKLSREKRQPLKIDARDSRDRTPLHLALQRGRKKIAGLLVTEGADRNLPDEKGMPPIHMCLRSDDSDFVKILFKVSDKKNLPVQVNVCYENYTPLQYAVENCLLDAVELLLDHGADLSNLVFPPASYFVEVPELIRYPDIEDLSAIKLMIVSGTLIIAERLEKNGYKFDQSKALMVMKVFDKQEMFNKPAIAVKNRLCADTKFVSKAEKIAMNSSLSLYDLVRLLPEEADKQLTYKDYFDFARKKKLTKLDQKHREDCVLHLSEIMSRRFFRRWAQDATRQLSGDPQSMESCDKSIDKFVTNKNLYHVCLTAAGQNS